MRIRHPSSLWTMRRLVVVAATVAIVQLPLTSWHANAVTHLAPCLLASVAIVDRRRTIWGAVVFGITYGAFVGLGEYVKAGVVHRAPLDRIVGAALKEEFPYAPAITILANVGIPIAIAGVWRLVFGPVVVQNGHTCPTCAYSLVGNTSGRCPECGTAL